MAPTDASTPACGVALPPDWNDAAGHAICAQVLAMSPDCVSVLSADGDVSWINPAGIALLEIGDTGPIYGQAWARLWPASGRTQVETALQEALSGGTSRFSCYCPTARGTPKWWDISIGAMQPDASGQQRFVAIARDMTQQKTTELTLGASERRFSALADNMAQFAWMADGAGALFWYNRRWYEYSGTTFAEMAGWGWRSVHHPEHVDRVVEKFREHIVSGEPWEDVFPLRSRDGEYRWFLSRAMPIRDEKGDVTLWCGTNTDITEDRNVALRLKQKARLIELSHEAIFVWDLATGIVTWNRGCRELYGHAPEEAIGADSHTLLHTTYPISVAELTATLQQRGSWAGQVFRRARSGREVWVDARQELIDTGERKLVLETNRDVTEKRKADELTRLLLSEVVHRVKNTLAIIQAITSQTARRSRSVAEFEASFNSRLQALSSAHNLLTSTAWSGAALSDVIATQIGDDAAQSIRICGPCVIVSAQTALQLGLITFELASNARKHGALSAPGGRVDVSWRPDPQILDAFEIVWRESGGPPVPQQRQQGFGTVLIERFGRQPNLKTSLEFPEEGARCAISVMADANARAAGSYFDPAVSSPPAPRAAGHGSTAGKRRVLIVEDEPLIAMDIEDILANAGHTPIGVAATVGAAMTDILKTSPDLVILDGNLFGKPVSGVIDLLRARSIPFVMVTGFSAQSLPRLVGDLGVAVVRKPIDKAKLLLAIDEARERHGRVE